MIYRVIWKFSYYKAFFEFADAGEAVAFAKTALEHMVESEDLKKVDSVSLQLINPEIEESEDDD
jgi:hypothetical protein